VFLRVLTGAAGLVGSAMGLLELFVGLFSVSVLCAAVDAVGAGAAEGVEVLAVVEAVAVAESGNFPLVLIGGSMAGALASFFEEDFPFAVPGFSVIDDANEAKALCEVAIVDKSD
jgi:hypothetical protein